METANQSKLSPEADASEIDAILLECYEADKSQSETLQQLRERGVADVTEDFIEQRFNELASLLAETVDIPHGWWETE